MYIIAAPATMTTHKGSAAHSVYDSTLNTLDLSSPTTFKHVQIVTLYLRSLVRSVVTADCGEVNLMIYEVY